MLFLSFKDSVIFAKYEKGIVDNCCTAVSDRVFIQ